MLILENSSIRILLTSFNGGISKVSENEEGEEGGCVNMLYNN